MTDLRNARPRPAPPLPEWLSRAGGYAIAMLLIAAIAVLALSLPHAIKSAKLDAQIFNERNAK